MNGERPVISVLMGVLNCEKTLDESLGCLLAQSESRWKLIICDDGSTDDSVSVIKRWQERIPDKIIFLQNRENRGLNYTLNRCLSLADGEFVARMDGDDKCSPDRFEKELQYLRDHPEYAIVSTDMVCFDEAGNWGLRRYPTDPQPKDLVHGTPFSHPACMVRKKAIDRVGGYSESEKFLRVEDYELWLRMYAAGYRGGNLHQPLYLYRDDRSAASRRKWKYRVNEARVRYMAVKMLDLPVWNLVFVLRPLILGLLPGSLSSFLHRMKLKGSKR